MKVSLTLIIFCLSSFSWAQTMDEADIPPPPMPDYMVESGYEVREQKREISSEKSSNQETQREVSQNADDFNVESAEDIKQEFLKAGEGDTKVAENPPVQQVIGGDIKDPADGPVIESAEMIVEDSSKMAHAEKLTGVEETIEDAESDTEQTLESSRLPSNQKKFKAGLHTFKKNCPMHVEPRSTSDELGSVSAGRKLWIDPHNDRWHKAYKKSSTVYIPAECLD